MNKLTRSLKRSSETQIHRERCVRIQRTDEERQIVYAEVYRPDTIDTWGEFMRAEDIEEMAHRFMRLAHLRSSIDTMHNEESNGSYPVESFIARAGDPDYAEGSWVLGVKIVDDDIWKLVKRGVLNGFSFQALVRKLPTLVEIDVEIDQFGVTEENEGHTHLFFVEMDDEGRIARGRTSTDEGHSHEIAGGTATVEEDGHSHRFFVE